MSDSLRCWSCDKPLNYNEGQSFQWDQGTHSLGVACQDCGIPEKAHEV